MMEAKKKHFQIKPIQTWKAVTIYILCIVLVAGLLVGNYFADAYRDLITVYLSGSGTVTTEDSEALCLEIQQEGMVLLKNDGGLPLKENARVTLLGQSSVDFVYGGAGSGSVETSAAAALREAMEEAGFSVKPTLWDFYTVGAGREYRKEVPDETGAGTFQVNEVPRDVYTNAEISSFAQYGDAAVVCIGRSGGESADIPTTPLASGYLYLEPDKDELDLLAMACENFQTVVVVINANNPMELGFLEDPAYANVKACLWAGGVGQEGIHAVAQALAGEINPSGHLVDTYAYDSLSAPSAQNLGNYTITNSTVRNGNKYLVYAEGIYVGYRYYETRYEDAVLGQGNAGDYNYGETVQFPFGYGLSYTDFAWSDYKVTEDADAFQISVTVTNTGSVAGKDVVQIYMQSPYTQYDRDNGIEKAAVELVGFAKTKLLDAGAQETITVTVPKELMKTYDASSAKTYIVDAGDYYFAAGMDAHDALNNILAAKGYSYANGMTADGNAAFAHKHTVAQQDNTTYAVSSATRNSVTNRFDDVDIRMYDPDFTYLTRSDWTGTMPATYQNGMWNAPAQLLADLEWKRGVDVVGTGAETMPVFENGGELKLSELVGKDYSDPAWEQLLQQLTADQAMRLVRLGGYATIQIDAIGLPSTQDKDGPSGISGTLVGGQSAMAYPVEVVMASTWDTALMERLGESIGEDSIATGVAGWYAPGVNIHRSPNSGRNFEYFSEDGFLSGQMSGAEVKGTRSKGVITYMKHFALNDQETNRYGCAVFANEQAIREIFLKGFELTVTLGDSNAAMASMNRLGATWAGAHKGLMTHVLREEWGFEGAVITDQASVPAMFYQDIISGLAAGTDLWLNTNKNYWKLDEYTEADGTVKDWSTNPAVMSHVQRAAKNVIYAVSTSNAMATADEGPTVAPWEIALTVLNVVAGIGVLLAAGWTTLRVVKTQQSKPKHESEEGDDIVKKPIVAILVVVALLLGIGGGVMVSRMTAAPGGDAPVTGAAEIVRTSIYGEIAGNTNNDNDYVEYELTLYADNTYKFTSTRAINGYSMLLGNTVVSAYGTYTMGESVDGTTACNLSEATRILYTSYSDVGGYNMSYDTNTLTYPVELPGGIMTEQADFWAQFGPARTIMLDDTNPSRMNFETGNPPPISKNPAKDEPKDDPTEPVEDPTEPSAPAEATEIATIVSDDEGTTMTFYSDGTYKFVFASYNVEDKGTYTVDGGKLTLVNSKGAEAFAEGDPWKIHYVSAMSDQLTGDFTIDASVLSGGATAEVTEIATIVSDDEGTTMTFYSDGTYKFVFASYNVEDKGTYSVDGGKLTLVNSKGAEASAEGDPWKIHYVSAMSDQLTGDFTIAASVLAG